MDRYRTHWYHKDYPEGQEFWSDEIPEGWVDTPDKLQPQEPVVDDPDELEALRAQAAELGIKVDGRWSVKTLREKLYGHGPELD